MRSLTPTAAGASVPTVVTAVSLLLCGCGPSAEAPAPAATPSTSSYPRTELTIERSHTFAGSPKTTPDGSSPQVWTLTCDPTGGTHPNPEAACAALAQIDTDVFDPVPTDQPCTLVYGGPETATVVGHIGHTKINAEFSRTNGCEIARWEQLGPLITP